MVSAGIPAWNTQGVLPPINLANPTSHDRSPYGVTLSEVVRRFGMNAPRRIILDGLLRYRSALQALGLNSGFQWLDGSFVENVEEMEGRPPNDVDVVTFFNLPPGVTELSIVRQDPDLFPLTRSARQAFKARFHVDAYLERLGQPSDSIVLQSAYWYSMWSHRRNAVWKGLLHVSLAPAEDAAARNALASLAGAGAPP